MAAKKKAPTVPGTKIVNGQKTVVKKPTKPTMTTVNGAQVSTDQAKWLAGDASYGQTQANLQQQLAAYQADRLGQRQNYAQDEVNALTKLGFKGAIYQPGKVTATDAAPVPTVNTKLAGWDQHDESGAFGRDMVSNADSFAARGAAGSGAFFKASGNLGQQYADQGSAILQAANRQQNDYTTDLSNYATQNKQTSTQALYDALARRAASLQTLS